MGEEKEQWEVDTTDSQSKCSYFTQEVLLNFTPILFVLIIFPSLLYESSPSVHFKAPTTAMASGGGGVKPTTTICFPFLAHGPFSINCRRKTMCQGEECLAGALY